MLKATCIVGSARANGSCNYLVDSVIRGMQESGIEILGIAQVEKDVNPKRDRYC